MPVAVYLRVSTEEQRERQSIHTQRDFAQRYTDLHQLSVYHTYADDGVSGTVAVHSRPAGQQLLEDARHRRFDQLLVFKLDRLGRDTRLTLEAVAQLEACGVAVRSMTEEFDSQSPSGRLMMTLLSGFATHEREVIRERSMAGTRRQAEAGVWLGGVVPYGYRKEGQKGHSRLVPSEQPLPGRQLSAADVVRHIYRWCAEQQWSCQQIADELNRQHIPCWATDRDGNGTPAGACATLWRPSRVRNLIVNRTYLGQHEFGKRRRKGSQPPVVRTVPALVSENQWQAAQCVLRAHRGGRARPSPSPYLLRGLIHCGLCGLAYSAQRSRGSQPGHYYRCNGRQFAHALYGNDEAKCLGKNLPGQVVDALVWTEIEGFLRRPEQILARLRQRLKLSVTEQRRREQELDKQRERRRQNVAERERMLGLFRRGRIDEATLDRHLDTIDAEGAELQAAIGAAERALSEQERAAQMRAAEKLLGSLRQQMEEPWADRLQRQMVEALVEKIEVGTVQRWGVPQTTLTISYRFTPPGGNEPLVLPLMHTLSSRHSLPQQLETIGDHLWHRRLQLGLLQRQVAVQVGVDTGTISNWEKNRFQPRVQHMPAVVRFLGYRPVTKEDNWAARLVQARRALGLSQVQAARQMRVVQCTLARWERGERQPTGEYAQRALEFLQAPEAAKPAAAAAGRA